MVYEFNILDTIPMVHIELKVKIVFVNHYFSKHILDLQTLLKNKKQAQLKRMQLINTKAIHLH